MRSTIRLTGRRIVPAGSVDVKLVDDQPQRITFAFRHEHHLNRFPRDSAIKLRLFENKASETIFLGTRADIDQSIERSLKNRFSRPACQLRIVKSSHPKKGLLLGSTPKWTIDSDQDGSDDQENRGILKFAVGDIGPKCWTLEFPESDYPTVYLNKAIPYPKRWARNDPVFIGLVLPAVIRQVFDYILGTDEYGEIGWMRNWIEWAKDHGAKDPPVIEAAPEDKEQWIDEVIYGFSLKNKVLQRLVTTLDRE